MSDRGAPLGGGGTVMGDWVEVCRRGFYFETCVSPRQAFCRMKRGDASWVIGQITRSGERGASEGWGEFANWDAVCSSLFLASCKSTLSARAFF